MNEELRRIKVEKGMSKPKDESETKKDVWNYSSDENRMRLLWITLQNEKTKELSYFDFKKVNDFEIFFRKYNGENLSCFENICMKPKVGLATINSFFDSLRQLENSEEIIKKYMNAKNETFGKTPLDFSIEAVNIICASRLCDIIELENEDRVRAITMIDNMKINRKDEKFANKKKDFIRSLLINEKKLTKFYWNCLYDFNENNFQQDTIDVLFEFFLCVELDSDIKENVLKRIPEKSIMIMELFEIVLNGDEDMFINKIEKIPDFRREEYRESLFIKKKDYTLLQLSCSKGLKRVVKILMETKCDKNIKNSHNESPIILAFLNRHNEILKILLSNGVKYDSKILVDMLKFLMNQKTVTNYNIRDYTDCMKVLATETKVCIKTICSFVLVRNSLETKQSRFISLLLANGASVNVCSKCHNGSLECESVLNHMSSRDLEQRLDDCLSVHKRWYSPGDGDLIFDYSPLKPTILPYMKTKPKIVANDSNDENKGLLNEEKLNDGTNTDRQSVKILPEVEFLLQMTKFHQMTPLIKHPLIQGFVHLKWQKMNCFFFVNILFFVLFSVALTFYILTNHFIALVSVWILFIILVSREVFVMLRCSSIYYFTYLKDWPCLILILSTLRILLNNSIEESGFAGIITNFIIAAILLKHLSVIPLFSFIHKIMKMNHFKFFKMISYLTIIVYTFFYLIKNFNPFDHTENLDYKTNHSNGSNEWVSYFFEFAKHPKFVFIKAIFEVFKDFSWWCNVLIIIIILFCLACSFAWTIHELDDDKDVELACLVKRIEAMSYVERLIFGIELKHEDKKSKENFKIRIGNIYLYIKESITNKIYPTEKYNDTNKHSNDDGSNKSECELLRGDINQEDLYKIKVENPFFLNIARKISIFPELSPENKVRVPLNVSRKYKTPTYLKSIKAFSMKERIVKRAFVKIEENYHNKLKVKKWEKLENNIYEIKSQLKQILRSIEGNSNNNSI